MAGRAIPAPLLGLAILLAAGAASGNQVEIRLDDDGFLVEYSIPGELVKIDLFRNGALAGSLSGWMENSGVFRYDRAIPTEAGTGPGFTVRVTSDLGLEVWSGAFETRVIDVIARPGGEALIQGAEADLEVVWEPWSEEISIDVYKGALRLERIAEGVPPGSWSMEWSGTVPPGWEPGDDYRLRLFDGRDSYGWSNPFSVAMDWEVLGRQLQYVEPGTAFSLDFPPGTGTRYFLLPARPLRAYSFHTDMPDRILIEILDPNGNLIISSDRGFRDGALYWDCLEGGEYFLRVSARGEATPGLPLSLEESPGWDTALTLEDNTFHTFSLNHPDDVEYFHLRLVGNMAKKEKCAVTVSGPDGVMLALVDPDEFRFADTATGGDEVFLRRNLRLLSGSRDLRFAVTGPVGEYTIRSKVETDLFNSLGSCFVFQTIALAAILAIYLSRENGD